MAGKSHVALEAKLVHRHGFRSVFYHFSRRALRCVDEKGSGRQRHGGRIVGRRPGLEALSDGGPEGGQDVEDTAVDLALCVDGSALFEALFRNAGREAAVADQVSLDQQLVRVVHQRVRLPCIVLLQVCVPDLDVAAHPHRLAHRPRPRHPPDEALARLHKVLVLPLPHPVAVGLIVSRFRFVVECC